MLHVSQELSANDATKGIQSIDKPTVNHNSARQSESLPHVRRNPNAHTNYTEFNHPYEKAAQLPQPTSSQNVSGFEPEMRSSTQGNPVAAQNQMAHNLDKLASHNKEGAKHVQDLDIELPPHDKDWQDKDWDTFTRLFNTASCVSDVKIKCNNIRTEKLALLVMRAEAKDCQIDPQRKLDWIINGESPRGRMPIVKVCKGNYIRISTELAERFGMKLTEGDCYEFSVKDFEGKECMVLTSLNSNKNMA